MNIADKRAIRITQLTEQLEEAKAIIQQYVWPPDVSVEARQKSEQRAARFAGCTVPAFKPTQPEATPKAEEQSAQERAERAMACTVCHAVKHVNEFDNCDVCSACAKASGDARERAPGAEHDPSGHGLVGAVLRLVVELRRAAESTSEDAVSCEDTASKQQLKGQAYGLREAALRLETMLSASALSGVVSSAGRIDWAAFWEIYAQKTAKTH